MGFDVDMKKLKSYIPVHGACPPRKWTGFVLFLCLVFFLLDCGRKIPTKNAENPANPYRWDFNDLKGWVDDSQNTGGPQNYAIEGGKLRIHTGAGTRDRAKVRTELKTFRAGATRWRVYVPAMGAGDQASIGAFLYHSDTRELDFEIGYGRAADRAAMRAGPDDLLMFTTSQADPYKTSMHLVKREQWHDLALELTLPDSGAGRGYQALWRVDGGKIEETQLAFGGETGFYIYCSVENLQFLGDHVPNQENYALFDYVEHSPQDTSRFTAK
jgi:hypothetical protein